MTMHEFNVKSLEQTCFDTLKDHLCPENCIGLWQFSKSYYIPIMFKLEYIAFRFICENFEEVSLCEEILQLAVQELADILGQGDLTVTQESIVYQSVLRWINHMPKERQGAIATLLPKIRLGLMDKSYITEKVLNNDVVKTNPESYLLVFNILQVMSQPWLLCFKPGINNMFRRRFPNAILLVTRCFSGTIDAFDYTTNSWITLPIRDDFITHYLYRTVSLDQYLYIVGCSVGWLDIPNRVWRFNLVTHTRQEMSPMHESRDSVSVTVLKGYIYALGGCENDTSLRTAERYQPNINQWTFIASMNEERANASCTTLNNKIYICGGLCNDKALNTAEYYNPGTNQWTLISPMGTPRFQLGVVAYVGHIFAVGGSDDSIVQRSAESYDPVTNTWHDVPEMIHRHYNVGIAVINKRIFVVSCWPEQIIECYDSTTNTWAKVFSGPNHKYEIMSCCVISGLPNMAEYCSPHGPVIPRIQC